MPINQQRKPPTMGRNFVGNALRDLWGSPDPTDELGGATVNISHPLPVYSLGLEDIQTPESLGRAKFVGWRYLLERGGRDAYADLIEGSAGSQKFSGLSSNRNAERLNQAAHMAEAAAAELPECEARILDIPALHVSALWLFGSASKFIPYIDPEKLREASDSEGIDPEFLNRIIRRAAELRQHSTTDGQSGS